MGQRCALSDLETPIDVGLRHPLDDGRHGIRDEFFDRDVAAQLAQRFGCITEESRRIGPKVIDEVLEPGLELLGVAVVEKLLDPVQELSAEECTRRVWVEIPKRPELQVAHAGVERFSEFREELGDPEFQ